MTLQGLKATFSTIDEVHVLPEDMITNHDDLQEVNHEYNRRIYTVRECICGRDELDAIHRTSEPDPNPDDQHRFERGARAANCKCGEPFWSPVHDAIKFEEGGHE